MEMPNPEVQTQGAPEPPGEVTKHPPPSPTWLPTIVVGLVVAVVGVLSIWYLVQPDIRIG